MAVVAEILSRRRAEQLEANNSAAVTLTILPASVNYGSAVGIGGGARSAGKRRWKSQEQARNILGTCLQHACYQRGTSVVLAWC
jgi:hypothetical protein